MKTKQLELFDIKGFETKHTYIKRSGNWFLFDNVKNRTNFERKHHYMMVCNIVNQEICDENSFESEMCSEDISAKSIGINEYLKVANLLRASKKYVFNKKIGKLISTV